MRLRLLAVAVAAVLGAFVAAPAYASTGADLTVRLSDKAGSDRGVQPGNRVTYRMTVFNKGPKAAKRVRVHFRTSAALRHIRYQISRGACDHRPGETVCSLGLLRRGRTVTVTISGVISKSLEPGDSVTNTVALSSSTHRLNKHDDVASDSYRISLPLLPPPGPEPTQTQALNPSGKIGQAAKYATKMFALSRAVAGLTLVVLAAGVVWFAAGLALRRRSRGRRMPNE